ncbi:hypothetical protein PG997_009019 [Apiospora hydei]|uniref:Branchpoint-bridging protein n=1 Tax=Apiospora hydei TaxID=1337664 RepID=A0ABR1WFA8_9PEZI
MATLANGGLTRWDPEGTAQRLPHLTTAVTGPMTSEQVDAYTVLVRARRRPPQYDASGVRTNTRHRRYRAALEHEYHALVQRAFRTFPNYRPPQGYVPRPIARANCSVTDKVYIPTREYPGVNFIGQLLGPRGRSLADMSVQSGAHIVIRGKGSVKEGQRGRRHSQRPYGGHRRAAAPAWETETMTDDPYEPLHCLITAGTRDKVDRAKTLVRDVI